jgi:hypothetical protein
VSIHSYIQVEVKVKHKTISVMTNVVFTPATDSVMEQLNAQFSVKARVGRPIDPNSKRQQRLATAPGKRTGRPVNPNSARQQRLAEMEAKRANGELRRGRPVNPNSKRQIALRAAAAQLLAEQSK